jgi:hypothetical protein
MAEELKARKNEGAARCGLPSGGHGGRTAVWGSRHSSHGTSMKRTASGGSDTAVRVIVGHCEEEHEGTGAQQERCVRGVPRGEARPHGERRSGRECSDGAVCAASSRALLPGFFEKSAPPRWPSFMASPTLHPLSESESESNQTKTPARIEEKSPW